MKPIRTQRDVLRVADMLPKPKPTAEEKAAWKERREDERERRRGQLTFSPGEQIWMAITWFFLIAFFIYGIMN